MAGEKLIPIEMNLDTSPLYLGNQKGRLVRNLDYAQYGGDKEGENAMVLKPLQATELVDPAFKLPAGDNRCAGKKVSHETNEVYVFVWNSLKNHCIYRIKKDDKCEMVFMDTKLNFQLNPIHFIGEGRCSIIPFCVGDQQKTFIAWTDGYEDNYQCCLCVEDSIASNFFSTNFQRFNNKFDRKQLFALGLAELTGCITIKEAGAVNSNTINRIKFRTWQFRISGVDVYNRPYEHGDISTLYYQSDCAGEAAQCLDITFPAGGPLLAAYYIEFRRNCSTEWSRHDVVQKYEVSDKPWWEKKINPKINYNAATNTVTYRFCADKECIPVPDVESQRVENPMPIVTESLFALGGGLALAGNKYGRKPFSTDLLEKIKFEVEKPRLDGTTQTQIQTRNITLWVAIWNPYNNKLQAIYDWFGKNAWGGCGDDRRHEDDVIDFYGQTFGEPDQVGFIGYLAGTSYATISEQYKWEGGGNLSFRSPNGKWVKHGKVGSSQDASDGIWMQKFEFKNIRPGKYVFRIAGHHSRLDQDYQKTSTYVAGVSPVQPNGDITFNRTSHAKEILIDVCEKDYDTANDTKFLQIWDMTEPHKKTNLRREIIVTSGYVWEKEIQDINGLIPIELAMVHTNASDAVRKVDQTDHNGFYFVGAKDKKYATRIEVRRRCQWVEIGRNDINERVQFGDALFGATGLFFANGKNGNGVHPKNFFASQVWGEFDKELCNRVIISGKVKDCDTGAGISGVTVGLQYGAFATTNNRGEWSLIAHDFSSGRNNDQLIFNISGGCELTTCDDKLCIPNQEYLQPPCDVCMERKWTARDILLKSAVKNRKGLQLGGRYGFGVKGADWMGRKGFIQTDNTKYLDIPTVNEIGGFAYPRIKWSIDSAARFPLWITKLYFNVTKNLRYSDFHSWVIDRLTLIDNTGLENVSAPTQIRVHYSSLSEYNKQHNFSTNSTWQVIDEKDSLKITDQVHIIANGDGKLFPTVITQMIRFDREGRYFLMDYTAELKDLKEGALIKFIREQECAEAELFYEVCYSIDVVNGVPVETSGYVDAFDSYFVSRQIPTPLTKKEKVLREVKGSNGQITYEEVEEETTTNVIKPYGWAFEHHSPSDFWGTKCANRGRVGVRNPMEGEICKQDEIALSGVLGTNGLVNYLHYFDERRKKVFNDKKRGSIVSCLVEGNVILAIFETDHCLIPFDDDAVRVGNDGTARANTGDGQLGKPQRKSGQNFGCSKRDRNVIAIHNGLVHWIDRNNVGQVYHNFQQAIEITNEKFNSFLREKIKKSKGYLHAHINPLDNQCYTTDFELQTPYYHVKDDKVINYDSNETWSTDLNTQTLRKVCSFTPEMYASLGDQFYSFRGALPYRHYQNKPTLFNNFYGKQCQHAMRIAFSFDNMKVEDYMALEVYVDNVLMYAPEVLTQFGQQSMIPRNWFKRGEKFWAAPFLCDLRTVKDVNFGKERQENVLFGGDKLRGRWIEVLFLGDPDNLGKYFELTGVILFANNVEKTGLR